MQELRNLDFYGWDFCTFDIEILKIFILSLLFDFSPFGILSKFLLQSTVALLVPSFLSHFLLTSPLHKERTVVISKGML